MTDMSKNPENGDISQERVAGGEISRWRDPLTGAWSCEIDSPGRSAENLLLFSAEAVKLGLMKDYEFTFMALAFENEAGLLTRYPGSEDVTHWDDMTGAAAISNAMAFRVYQCFKGMFFWRLPNGDWIGRMPLLQPTVLARAGRWIWPHQQLKAALCYFFDMFVHRDETSGRIILWLCQERFERFWFIRFFMKRWRKAMARKYESPAEMFEIYFPPKKGVRHPFVVNAPGDWK